MAAHGRTSRRSAWSARDRGVTTSISVRPSTAHGSQSSTPRILITPALYRGSIQSLRLTPQGGTRVSASATSRYGPGTWPKPVMGATFMQMSHRSDAWADASDGRPYRQGEAGTTAGHG